MLTYLHKLFIALVCCDGYAELLLNRFPDNLGHADLFLLSDLVDLFEHTLRQGHGDRSDVDPLFQGDHLPSFVMYITLGGSGSSSVTFK